MSQDWTARTEDSALSFGFDFDEVDDGLICIGTDTFSLADDQEILVAKFDHCGDMLWEQNLAPPYPTVDFLGSAITGLNDGNYAGWGVIGNDSIYLFKMNPLGEIIWENLIPGGFYMSFFRPVGQIEEDDMGNIYILTNRTIVKFDATGDVLWIHNFLEDDNTICKRFQIDSDNNLLMIGRNLGTGWGTLVKCDAGGSILFAKDAYLLPLAIKDLGTQIVIGGKVGDERILYFHDLAGDTINSHILPYYMEDPWLLEHEGELKSFISRVDLLSNGNLVLRSNYSSASEEWIRSYIVEYNFISETIVSETMFDDTLAVPHTPTYSGDAIATSDGGFAALGANYSAEFDNIQMAIWKFNDNCALISTAEHVKKAEITIFPNPTSNSVQIYGTEEFTSISIYDISGKMLYFNHAYDGNEIHLSKIPQGAYLVQVETMGQEPLYFKLLKE
ncbi:MAG: hypothetical protein ACI8ZM_005343 [Crocinitomix sp.]|jgi:hypothetical protein